ncbi:MAG: Nif11-like leader peptide family RiPP precursor [Lachnospiraceae bacterium]|nr:Nif11-like leader peptide family RiPP precursor [Lachnospiraceae bacterium]
MKQFLEEMEKNEELKAKVEELNNRGDSTVEDFIALTKEFGFALTEEDFFGEKKSDDEISEDEMDAVAGGGVCKCAVGGYGGGESGFYYSDQGCVCVVGGGGDYLDGADEKYKSRCICVLNGYGETYTK